jgi:hypothetical protein
MEISMDFNTFCKLAFKNKEVLKSSIWAGCYCCCSQFNTSDIKEWVDRGETAICPKCGIDSVIPIDIADHEKYVELLKLAKAKFF